MKIIERATSNNSKQIKKYSVLVMIEQTIGRQRTKSIHLALNDLEGIDQKELKRKLKFQCLILKNQKMSFHVFI